MPTGYTAAIADGISFEQFVWSCARAFGALVMMRDDPMPAEIPQAFEPTDYHTKRINEANDELVRLRDLSGEMMEREAQADYEERLQYFTQSKIEDIELAEKYRAMLEQVNKWEPPSSEHQSLKDFMVQQITESLRFDCGYEREPPERLTGAQWWQKRTDELKHDIGYHIKAHQEEVERVNGRNKWLADLRGSVPYLSKAEMEAKESANSGV